MALQGRVGRHASTGVQCQNWVADQMAVITLLNIIPPADGGAGGTLPFNPPVAGICSDALYKAILAFQKKQVPAQQTGFVDPGGPVLAKLEALVSRSAPAATPKSTGQWDEFQSGSVQRALNKALQQNDGFLSQVQVADILFATISNGTVSTSELADLKMVTTKSKSIMPRSKAMLELFVEQGTKNRSLGQYKLDTQARIDAAELVCTFMKLAGRGRWPGLDRDEVGVGLLMRLAYPSLLRQGQASLCGPAAFIFNLVQDRPSEYAGFAIRLYNTGTARMGSLTITPRDAVRQYAPTWQIDPADWVTMAGLRDSEDWWFSYDTADRTFSGATTQLEMAWWFNRAGYSDIRQEANLTRHQRDTDNMDEASRLFSEGYRVCLLIDGQMIQVAEQGTSGSALFKDRHWVVLRSKIDRSGDTVNMLIFTWGEKNRKVPESGALPLSDFLENYYGYVAAKP
jgi:hypothetical protein